MSGARAPGAAQASGGPPDPIPPGDTSDPELCVVLVNAPPNDAPRIARALVERRLAACVNVVPGVASFYVWEGKLTEDTESTLVVKTRRALVGAIGDAMGALHPYSVPEVIALPLLAGEGNPAYLAWVAENTRS